MKANPLVPSFYYNDLARAISAPFSNLNAYRSGVIDNDGNFLKPESSVDPFEYFVIKLKKIFNDLPPGMMKATITSYIPALNYFTEEAESFGIPRDEMNLFIEGLVLAETNGEESYLELMEEMGSANLGGPASSSGYNQGGISGHDAPMQGGVQRRRSILGFENSCEMFDVCPEEYAHFCGARSWRHIPDSESKRYIYRRLGRSGKKVAIRNNETGEIHWPMFEDVDPIQEYIKNSMVGLLSEKIDMDVTTPITSLMGQVKNESGEKVGGASTEKLARLVHGARALATALQLGDEKTVRELSKTFVDTKEKSTSSNAQDAYDVDPKTGLIIPISVKGHTTTPAIAIPKEETKKHSGVEDVIGKLQDELRKTDLSPKEVAELSDKDKSDREEKRSTAKKDALDLLKNLQKQTGRSEAIKDTFSAATPQQIVSVNRSEKSTKPFRFPFQPTLLPDITLKDYGKKSPGPGSYLLRTSNPKREGGQPGPSRVEVMARVPDISSVKSFEVIKDIASQAGGLGSGRLTADQMEILLKNIDQEHHEDFKTILGPYVS